MDKELLAIYKKTEDEVTRQQLSTILQGIITEQCPSCLQVTKLTYFQNEWGRKTNTCYQCRRNASTQTMEEYIDTLNL